MNSRHRLFLFICLVFCALPLWAGDCSSPGDCKAIPDNVSRGAVLISVFTAVGLAIRANNNQDNDDDDDGTDDDSGDDWTVSEATKPAGSQTPGDPGPLR